MTAPHDVDHQLQILTKGCETVIRPEDLAAKLKAAAAEGRPLVVKAGFDPSAPDIHLGHTVLIRKMKAFQDLGHEVHFVVGDFTAMIGDPTGKSKTRPQLSREQVVANADTYKLQACKILDEKATRLDYNSTWLAPLGADGFIRLAAQATVAQMVERDDFKKRLEKGVPVSVHEFLYPLCQAYDSVALKADVELGGTDQTWNLLMGRDIMREYGLPPQVVMTTPLLEGTDGVEKMSKSLGNAIGIDEPAAQMFAKTMSISDELMWKYWTLLTDLTPPQIEAFKTEVTAGRLHPMDCKKDLAARIVTDFQGSAAAQQARAEFEAQVQRKERPDDIPVIELASDAAPELVVLMAENGLAKSRSEARRLISQGGVEVDGEKVTDLKATLSGHPDRDQVLKVGKRKYRRIRFRP